MTDKQPTQAMDTKHDGSKDGVGDAPGKTAGGSESSGGAYPNPHTGKKPGGAGGGFMGHGGQSGMEYSGTGDKDTDDDVGNENAVTK
ncbi:MULTISPECIES: hypothetical protein [unclassified Sphingomonas]|jgi:hypothetical protein|uniref:hypothetical protein n=1 Tax=unclassified Sphingomonas TaxID=196159 RepID=UPI00226A06F6|nr:MULTISPECIES: hypothetical protein [unclassified Sphingomonas]